MSYIENPKTKDSGILCAIPQKGKCPLNCPGCFYNEGRSYLNPIKDNTPNMPSYMQSLGRIIRVNDGGDSSINRAQVINDTLSFARKFYNTSIPDKLDQFDAPVVLTCNPAQMTDKDFYKVDPIPDNLMMVRVRVNVWNIELVDKVVFYYTARHIPVVLTFLAYFKQPIPDKYKDDYEWRTRVQNSYWCVKQKPREQIVDRYKLDKSVHVCGHRSMDVHCKYCGNCLKFYFATMERLRR